MKKPAVTMALCATLGITGIGVGVLNGSAVRAGVASARGMSPLRQENYEQIQRLEKRAQDALDAGDSKAATRYARECLLKNNDKTSWDYGNAIYKANQILGLAALRDGDMAAAKAYLLAAGKTPGSPQLDTFGPDMILARELLKKGEKQTVSTFLTSVQKFWGVAPANATKDIAALYAMHNRMILQWQAEIKAGKQPSLDTNDYSAASGPSTKRAELLAVGTTAPDFSALDKDGKPVKLSDYRGKVVVLDFWASWCPPCVASMPHNQAVAKKLQSEGVPVVILAVDNSEERTPFTKWVSDHKEMDSVLFVHADPKTADIAGKSYNVTGIPTQYVIDAKGVIRKSFVGFGGPNDDLEKAVRAAQMAP